MSWEIIESGARGRWNQYGDGWHKHPAVAITKHGALTMNGAFCAAYSIKTGSALIVMFDSVKRIIGIKVATSIEEPNAVPVRTNNKIKSGEENPSRIVRLKALTDRIPDCHGRAFRAHLNPGERVIEVSLAPDNRTK